MFNLLQKRQAFVRQLADNDCGIACISMILKAAGRGREINMLRDNIAIPDDDGLSLLELREIAGKAGFTARCVQMDFPFLRSIQHPCILLTVLPDGRSHFQVCYGVRKRGKNARYLMADPARNVYYINEDKLNEAWPGKAALFFENFPPIAKTPYRTFWKEMFGFAGIPGTLWLIIPLLNLSAIIFGIALSWLLQRGIEHSMTGRKESFIAAIVLLLFMVSLSRGIIAYIRQRLMIVMNSRVNEQFTLNLIYGSNYSGMHEKPAPGNNAVRSGLAEIQKIQFALSSLLGALASDGSFVLVLTASLFYFLTLAGCIMAAYLLLILLLNLLRLPVMLFDYADLKERYGSCEKKLVAAAGNSNTTGNGDDIGNCHYTYKSYLNFDKNLAVKISKINLLHDWLGTVCVISVFIVSFSALRENQLSYTSFMITVFLAYVIAGTLPKICNALITILEGADAYNQFSARYPEID
jgi:ABC-type bacteriocin/lantibiotic exporter with double-glycine peptidase domain